MDKQQLARVETGISTGNEFAHATRVSIPWSFRDCPKPKRWHNGNAVVLCLQRVGNGGMSKSQRRILCLGLSLIALAALFPPWWASQFDSTYRHDVGRFFLWNPPERVIVPMPLPSDPKRFFSYYGLQVRIGRLICEVIALASLTSLAILVVPGLLRLPSSIRGRSRRRRGLCLSCGYNLTGNTSGVCPECGGRMSGDLDQTPARRGRDDD